MAAGLYRRDRGMADGTQQAAPTWWARRSSRDGTWSPSAISTAMAAVDLMWQNALTGSTAEWLTAPTGGVGAFVSTPDDLPGWSSALLDEKN